MKHYLLPLLFLLLLCSSVFSQNVGIGTNAPDASAKLDIVSTNSGVMVPRIALTDVLVAAPVTAPATSLLVYNTTSNTNVTPGYYYWEGAKWVRLNDVADMDWKKLDGSDAQSLTDSIFTNGNVGIGTNAPVEFLHIAGGQGRADNAQIGNGRNADGRLKFLNNGWGRIGSENGLTFWPNGQVDIDDNPAMIIEQTGRVGIGTVLLSKALLEVNGFQNYNHPNFVYYARDGANNPTTGGIGASMIDISIYASNRIVGLEFDAHSDERIKNIQGVSDKFADLDILNQIEITDYTFKDQSQNSKTYKKVIAQQVEKVYPQATSLTTEVVPDIYQLAEIKNGQILLENDLKPGEKVKLVFPDKTELKEVLSSDSHGFKIASERSGEVFVYGREVDDFHLVDYEAISMLNVSASQALHAKIQSQEELIQKQAQLIDLLMSFKNQQTQVNNELKAELNALKVQQRPEGLGLGE